MQAAEWQLNEDQIRSLHLEVQIGEGSYGRVLRARDPGTCRVYAVKVVEIDVDQDDAMRLKETAAYKTMEQEISILKTCQFIPQIVRVFGVGINFGEDLKARVMVVMELCEHGSVSDILRKLQGGLTEPEIRVIVREVLHGLKFLHDDKKIHRDVKAGNILLTRKFCPKLADFGISCELQNTFAKRDTVIGSPYWMAPEVIKTGFGYNSRADIWSLGITCIEMAELQPPYYHIPPSRAMFVICTKPPTGLTSPEAEKQFSPDFMSFVAGCLAVDPKERPSAQDLLAKPFARRKDGETPSSETLEASLGPRLAVASAKEQPMNNASWQRRSPSGSLIGVIPRQPAPDLGDPFSLNSGVTGASPSSTIRSRFAGGYPNLDVGSPGSVEEDEDLDPEEIRRRAREWVNKTVPMPVAEDDEDSPQSMQKPCNVWDSDEEGVVTRTRAEAQPEAGAGGPASTVPFFMQVLNKQWGQT